MDDLLAEFLSETSDRMARLDGDLSALARTPDDAALLDDVHSLLRMIKGTSGFLRLFELESLAQAADAVVERLRAGDIELTEDVQGLVRVAFDRISTILDHLRETGEEPGHPMDRDRLVNGLSALAETGVVEPGLKPEGPAAVRAPERPTDEAEDRLPVATDRETDPETGTVRVRRDVLENLMRMVSELGATRNQLMDILRNRGDGAVDASLRRLSDVTSVLRRGVLEAQSKPLEAAVIVQCRDQRFALLQADIDEVLSVGETSGTVLEQVRSSLVLRQGDRLVPVVSLASVFELAGDDADSATARDGLVVVARNGDALFGILVDAVLETEEIVVQPVASVIRGIDCYAGTTVLADGSVAMVLNSAALAAPVVAVAGRPALGDSPSAYLLFRAGGERPMAVPLAKVVRLEEVDFEDVSIDDAGVTLAYRDRDLPLVPVGEGIDLPDSGRKPVLVIGRPDGRVGLVVDEVSDIVDTRIAIQPLTGGPGLLGSAVLKGVLTDIVDADHYCDYRHREDASPTPSAEPPRADAPGGKRLLLIDDSAYIRNLLAPILTASGYTVLTAATAEQALAVCDRQRTIDAILCDTDLPDSSCYDFIESLRRDRRWAKVPVIAVSSRAAPDDLQKDHRAGFTDRIEKYNRDGLLQALADCV